MKNRHVKNRLIVSFFFSIALFMVCFASPSFGKDQMVQNKSFTSKEIRKMQSTNAVIKTRLGNITLEFFPEKAPNHVENFIRLAKQGFYNGTTFHRVIPGFMIQGGDPNTKSDDRSAHGTGGPGYHLKAEFNDTPHKRGILSMARAQDPDSAGSQFFICVADVPHLDGKYTAFGRVTDGMETADKIVAEKRDKRDNPLERVEITVEILEKEK